MQENSPAFTNTNALTSDIATYKVGSSIKFWDMTERTWVKGRITTITQCDNFFVSVKITYKSHRKHRQMQIFREDWLDTNLN